MCAFRVSMAAAVGVCTAVALCVWVVAAVVLLFVCGCAVRVCVVFGRFRCAAVLVLCVCSRSSPPVVVQVVTYIV